VLGFLSLGVKWLERGADPWPPSGAKVKSELSYTFILSCLLLPHLYLCINWHSTVSQKTLIFMGTVTLILQFVILYCKVGRTLIGVGTNSSSNMGLAVINLVVCNLPPTSRTDVAKGVSVTLNGRPKVALEISLCQQMCGAICSSSVIVASHPEGTLRFKSCGIWCCCFECVVPDVLKDDTALIFRVKESKKTFFLRWKHYAQVCCKS
jgi:hypothetical protein